MQTPRIFISYSHDSDAHRDFVLALANQLRKDGLDCRLDQYVNGFPAEGWLRWMETQIEQADFVLLICTEAYLKRFRGQEREGGRGVTFEGIGILQSLYDDYFDNTKFVPVLPELGSVEHIPHMLKQYAAYRLGADYEKLYRLLTVQPEVLEPALGPIKKLPSRPHRILTGDTPAGNDSAQKGAEILEMSVVSHEADDFLQEQQQEIVRLLQDESLSKVFAGLQKSTKKRHEAGDGSRTWLAETLSTEMQRGELTALDDYYQVVGKVLVTLKRRVDEIDDSGDFWVNSVQLLIRLSLCSVPGQDIYYNRRQLCRDIPTETALGRDLYLAVLSGYVPELVLQKSDARNPHSFTLTQEAGWETEDEFDVAFRQIWFAVEREAYSETIIRADDIAFLNEQLKLARNHPFLPRKLALVATAAESERNPLFDDAFYRMLQDKLQQLPMGREKKTEGLCGFANETLLRSRVVTFLRLIEEINQL